MACLSENIFICSFCLLMCGCTDRMQGKNEKHQQMPPFMLKDTVILPEPNVVVENDLYWATSRLLEKSEPWRKVCFVKAAENADISNPVLIVEGQIQSSEIYRIFIVTKRKTLKVRCRMVENPSVVCEVSPTLPVLLDTIRLQTESLKKYKGWEGDDAVMPPRVILFFSLPEGEKYHTFVFWGNENHSSSTNYVKVYELFGVLMKQFGPVFE